MSVSYVVRSHPKEQNTCLFGILYFAHPEIFNIPKGCLGMLFIPTGLRNPEISSRHCHRHLQSRTQFEFYMGNGEFF